MPFIRIILNMMANGTTTTIEKPVCLIKQEGGELVVCDEGIEYVVL